MSRFEPNVEPSMEEILASIRKIIAEDTSGSRTVPPPAPSRAPQSPVRPNAGVRPAAPQQRGFMSREAFMKSSSPADEPGEQRFFTPVTPPQDPVTPESASKSASGVSAAKAAPAPAPAAVKVEPKSVETQAAVAIKSSEPEKTQAPSIKPEQERPAEASIAAEVQAIVEAEHKSATVETSSEAQLIDAQLVELLGEDLKALREADERQDWKSTPTLDAAARVAPAPAVAAPKPAEPAAKVNGAAASIVSPPAAARVETPETPTVADPFAFDLGPSPFLPRALNEKPAEQQISVDPPQAPLRASVPQQPDSRPSPATHGWPKANGSPVVQETARPAAAPTPTSAPRMAEPQPAPAAARPQTFAVPSVSATLGPHRTLEPLSDSFKPAAPAHSKPAEP